MRRKLIVLIGISITMIIAMILITDPKKMADILGKTDLSLVLCVVGLYIANGVVKAIRWYILVRSFGGRIPLSRIYLFLLIGLMINNTTPGRIAGEPVRAYLLRFQDKVPMGQGLSTIFVERITDLIVLTSMALIGIGLIIPLLLISDISIDLLFLLFIPVIAVIVTFIYLATHPEFIKRIGLALCVLLKKFSNKGWVLKVESGLISFVDSFSLGLDDMRNALWQRKKNGMAFIVLTLLIWLNEAGRIYLILLAVGIEAPSFGAVLIASSIATVFGVALPIGAMHATLITSVFAALGVVEITSASLAGLLIIMTSIWLSIPLGLIAMFMVGLKRDKTGGVLVKKGDQSGDDVS